MGPQCSLCDRSPGNFPDTMFFFVKDVSFSTAQTVLWLSQGQVFGSPEKGESGISVHVTLADHGVLRCEISSLS